MASKSVHPLGDLEIQVMEVLWREGKMTVRTLWLRDEFNTRAYTTMMTTMDRLYRKGLLRRASEKTAYVYWPSQSKEDYWKDLSRGLMSDLMQMGGIPVLSTFLDAADEQDEENLVRLEAMIRHRRAERIQHIERQKKERGKEE